MKKIAILVAFILTLAITSICSAFEIDRSQWINFANVNNIEAFYNQVSIKNDGNVARVWICYHYKNYDTYRLMCKEYTKGNDRARILKTLDYYSDGTFKQGSSKVVENVALGLNEEMIVQRLWQEDKT